MGTWLSLFNNWETFLGQFVALLLVVGSYFAAEYFPSGVRAAAASGSRGWASRSRTRLPTSRSRQRRPALLQGRRAARPR